MEHEIQVAIFTWAKNNIAKYPELALLHASLEGVRLPIGLAVKMKKAGMRAGFPDIILDVARGGYHGFRLELKAPGGKLSKTQKLVHQALINEGYCVVTAYGFKDAVAALQSYLSRA